LEDIAGGLRWVWPSGVQGGAPAGFYLVIIISNNNGFIDMAARGWIVYTIKEI